MRTPITISAKDDEKNQLISLYEGLLKQQKQYTDNAVANYMRLLKIVENCDECRVLMTGNK